MSLRLALRDALRRLSGVARRGSVDARLDEEMRFHVDMLAERMERGGLSRDEAARRARATFGGTQRFKEEARDEYGSRALDELGQDARYAARVLRRNPGFTAAATVTLALGIGAATSVFSVVHGVLLRPLPYAEPDRLVVLWERHVARGRDRNVVAVPNFEAWRDRSRSFEGMAGLVPAPMTVSRDGGAERVVGALVSPGYFGLLGVRPSLGREFTDAEATTGATVVILSDAFWKTHLGGDRSVLGRTIPLDGAAHTVIGVMPATFDPPRFGWLGDQAFWLPFAATAQNRTWGRFLLVVARLRQRVSLDAARAEMVTIGRQRAREVKSNEGWSVAVVGLAEQLTGDVRAPLLVLLGAVALLLVMAVTNVANLTLGFARRRAQELAVRRAIGATGRRLVRQLLTQSALLGALGCAAGVTAAFAGVHALRVLMPADVPRVSAIRVDLPVLLVTAAVAGLATLAIGGVAALRGIPRSSASALGAGTQARVSAKLGGGALVTTEIALALVLTVVGGLMVRTFATLRAVDLGFEGERVVAVRLAASTERYATREQVQEFFTALLDRVRALPAVEGAGAVSIRPFGGEGPATSVTDPARPLPAGVEPPVTDIRYADSAYFATLRIPLLAGSLFDERDRGDAPPRVVINQAMARSLWPGENPIGRRVHVVLYGVMVAEVIGVVRDVRLMDVRTPARPTVYFAGSRFPAYTRDIVIRTHGDPDAVVSALRAVVAALDPTLPMYQVKTMDGVVAESLARDRFTTLILGAFAVASLLLAAVGVYGVFAGDVAQRRKEIGIRLALGARTTGVIVLVLRRALGRAGAGIAIGVLAAVPLTRAMGPLLFGVRAGDRLSFVSVAVILLAVALTATLVPALRAARVSPLIAIRTD